MSETTIQETFTLPSKGKLYETEFDPKITLRSMTTMDEMKRLSPSDSEYRTLSEIIESCIAEKLPISVYDMCMGDYIYLLHKLRIVTYGSEYKMVITCPNCGEIVNSIVDLDKELVIEYDPKNYEDMEITLPVTKKKILLRLQTPRMFDNIKDQAKELKMKTKDDSMNYELLFGTMSYIAKIDGSNVNDIQKEAFVRKLPMKDVYYILQKGAKFNGKVGIDTSVIAKCPKCGYECVTSFRPGQEFFGPTFDE
jgi:predicted RNA-binding Zn-ribbon protein involved in translation (DUF1610 family)